MLTFATLTGSIHALAAQEITIATQRGSNTPEQNIVVQKPLVETSAPASAAPVQAYIPPAEKLLSEMKININTKVLFPCMVFVLIRKSPIKV